MDKDIMAAIVLLGEMTTEQVKAFGEAYYAKNGLMEMSETLWEASSRLQHIRDVGVKLHSGE